jgi:cation diffusion facilitator family transporter
MMHSNFIDPWTQNHTFLGRHHNKHEQRTWTVVALTAVMMAVEIIGGTVFGSLALVADGWHMATHVVALAIAALAYLFARRHASDARFSLGTGKFGELAAFGSAIILGMIAIDIAYDSLLRLGYPVVIDFQEAIPIAALGLCVNLASAWLLRDEHHHTHDGAHDHDHAARGAGAHHHDINIRAAYVHVLADALISILAIAGLSAAWALGWNFIDPLVGLVGAVVIASWSFSLLRTAGCVLLDTVPSPDLAERIRRRMELDGDRVCDLHVWQVGPGHLAVMASIVSEAPQPPSVYKQRLADLTGLSHVTVEVHAHTP